MEKCWQNQVALVTGSTRGIGWAIAQALAQEGLQVILNTSSSQSIVDASVKKLPGGVGRHWGFCCDVSNEGGVREFAQEVDKRFGRCDLLINNAAFTKFIPHHKMDALSEDIFDKTVSVNLKAPFLVTRAFLKLLRCHSPSLVLNIASIAAQTGIGSSVAYCASKAGLVTMTRSLARALAPDIRVNSISPGLVDTALTKNFDPEYREDVISKTPLGRLVTPKEIAGLVVSLAKDGAMITGHDFVIDGGYLWRY